MYTVSLSDSKNHLLVQICEQMWSWSNNVKPLIDNHDSGYLEMAVKLYVQAHLGHYHILCQKEYCQKRMAQLKFTPPFLPVYA